MKVPLKDTAIKLEPTAFDQKMKAEMERVEEEAHFMKIYKKKNKLVWERFKSQFFKKSSK